MRLMARLLWWYTFYVQAFVSAAVRCFRDQIQMLDTLARSHRSAVQALKNVLRKVAEMDLPMQELREDLRRLEGGLGKLESAQIRANQTAEDFASAMPEFRHRIEALTSDLAALARTVDSLRAAIGGLGRQMEALTGDLAAERQGREALTGELKAAIGELGRQMEALTGDLAAERQGREALAGELKAAIGELGRQMEALTGDLAAERQGQEEVSHRISAESERGRRLDERISELGLFTHQTRTELRLQERRISLLLTEARKRLPGPLDEGQLRAFARLDHHKYDMLYLTFEDVYRGAREEIRSRQSVYLPLLQEHKIGSPTMPVLDIGCGRGEWLELLRENGLNARGVDTNEAMVEYCRRLDLKVTQADAIEHLRGLEGRSLGAVTVFHVLEHLTFDNVIELLDEALRVLKPGGLVILETPNPANLLVGAHTFYLDPTHQRPLPSGLLRFLVEARGFCDVSVKELNPPDPSVRLPEDGSIIARRLNDYLYGPQDYAVIGWKL
jgi:SAM-dependent methyltransferase/predicted  nucleic acid-binding Zn-ribbon protein